MTKTLYDMVYLVDDDHDDAFLIERAFRKVSSETSFVHLGDGSDFLRCVNEGELKDETGLVLLDINMPRVSGFDVLKKLEGQSIKDKLTFVVFSTSEEEQDRKTALALGAKRFATKPYSFSELLDFAGSVLQET